MRHSDSLDLSLALVRLDSAGPEHFAIWVIKAPFPGGYVHHDDKWSVELTQCWVAWQEMFTLGRWSPTGLRPTPHLPVLHARFNIKEPFKPTVDSGGVTQSYGGRLMQELGVQLWRWLLQGPVRSTFAQSCGMAQGQKTLLRLRLDVRDPNLIPLPWEVMQPAPGKPAIALNQEILFSRTTNDVDPLSPVQTEEELRILLVLGQPSHPTGQGDELQLQQEAELLQQVINPTLKEPSSEDCAPVKIEVLVQPTPVQLIRSLETGRYNIFFYAGHGMPAPDGGSLFLHPQASLNGTELAQVLVRTRVTLALFNACWGAYPEQQGQTAVPRSSLAEVLIHHGVPAVVGMRDAIADQEALTFIQHFTTALTQHCTLDQAMAIARQQLLTLYKFNQPAWTLPILYMHPDFNGQLLRLQREITELPTVLPEGGGRPAMPLGVMRMVKARDQTWSMRGGSMRVGRHPENDLVIQEQWVSQQHGEIFYRDTATATHDSHYFLRDASRFGTYVMNRRNNWQLIHHEEIRLASGMRLKFGSTQGEEWEFLMTD
ncbi:CHAT domain-containing protein [Spirulina sp. CCNP1310]|uniref:CHAT domain-containing protein n=1 Tax=Spirulina sp. CCNP1310 TaxID=3110249 RepID=UPI002B1F334F|nr:CHAT domain-containing protein [Spirulina sp. CCNP1310]MEA5420398.1 CHAT domain-containing protein [Spirulina sp. CCNP1310]